ncbi:hypothetical protein DAEQUDRAFT_335923 [Daedalea quercina L-15889]|uniref:Uncharacterized protein n=1 Tax=Daedalea quercina L-15889 TaxID=1314783 RepID=A0A165PI05_9APHY|nr:hypothetical protein DAEQUDRAFT_335923 [Daedalea quercina L-15889]
MSRHAFVEKIMQWTMIQPDRPKSPRHLIAFNSILASTVACSLRWTWLLISSRSFSVPWSSGRPKTSYHATLVL